MHCHCGIVCSHQLVCIMLLCVTSAVLGYHHLTKMAMVVLW
jgi:hypothetical protein